MKTIILIDGSETLVSDEDWEYLQIHNWYPSNKAVCRKVGRRNSRMHCEVALRMGLTFLLVDHKDRNWLNNQRDNLRAATYSTNGMNRTATRGNLYSSYKGVTFHHGNNKWKAQIQKDKRNTHIGYYDSEDQAALAYNHYALRLFGEFAYLNVIE